MSRYEFGTGFTKATDEAPWDRFFSTLQLEASYPEAGVAEVVWADPSGYTFPGPMGGWLVQGGMLAMLADTAMGHATFTLIDEHQSFLTGDLRIDFLRAAPTQPLLGIGRVDRRARRVYHCSAQLVDADRSTVFAESRCVQVILGN